jgi:hypothetical protein
VLAGKSLVQSGNTGAGSGRHALNAETIPDEQTVKAEHELRPAPAGRHATGAAQGLGRLPAVRLYLALAGPGGTAGPGDCSGSCPDHWGRSRHLP